MLSERVSRLESLNSKKVKLLNFNDKNSKIYIISPSALSYKCDHCAYLKHHFDLENRGVPVGVTQTLDKKQKEFFETHGTKAISKELPDGKIIDPGNTTFSSIIF